MQTFSGSLQISCYLFFNFSYICGFIFGKSFSDDIELFSRLVRYLFRLQLNNDEGLLVKRETGSWGMT